MVPKLKSQTVTEDTDLYKNLESCPAIFPITQNFALSRTVNVGLGGRGGWAVRNVHAFKRFRLQSWTVNSLNDAPLKPTLSVQFQKLSALQRESRKISQEWQGLTLGVHFRDVSAKTDKTV